MAATIAITSGTTETASADITIAAGGSVLMYLVDAAGPSLDQADRAIIEIKTSTGDYFPLGFLTGDNAAQMVYAPSGNALTIRVLRPAAGTAFGVEYL